MESKKDDNPLKVRFLEVRKEIYKRYTEKEQTEEDSETLKRGMTECERESEVIEIDNDITTPCVVRRPTGQSRTN
jgi:hypothetical protein